MVYKSILNLAIADRPREKLKRKNASALSDFELLEILVGNGVSGATVGAIAHEILKLFNKGIDAVTLDSLVKIKGVSLATASKILAALEISKRYLITDSRTLQSYEDILRIIQHIRDKKQEYLICITLDGGQRLISERTIAIGSLDNVSAHPREVFAEAITDRAAQIIIAHNHPSGNITPTKNDLCLTQQLKAAGQLIGINLYDHIIISQNNFYSFRQNSAL